MVITTVKLSGLSGSSVSIDHSRARRNNKSRLVSRAGIATAAVATAAMLTTPVVSAADLRITPNLNIVETYTDNVGLQTRGNERSDFVTQISPGFTLVTNGPRLKANATYALQTTYYAQGTGATSTSNQLNANATAEFVRDLFFMDARASVQQQNISAFGPQSVNNVNINDNRADVRTYSLSPYLRHTFGNSARGELRYSHESVGTNSDLLGISSTDRLLATLDSGRDFGKIGWGLRTSTQTDHYNARRDIQQSAYSGNVRYALTPTFGLTAQAGYEKHDYTSIGDEPRGGLYNVGFNWAPSPRTNVTATVGHRFFGRTYSLLANQRSRHMVFTANYSEDITTSQAQFLGLPAISTAAFLDQLYLTSIPDPIARAQVIETFIRQNGLPSTFANPVNSFTSTYFLEKKLQGSVAFNGARNTVVVTGFDTRRMAQSPGQLSAGSNTQLSAFDDSNKQIGANVLWNLRLSQRASANANINYTRTTSLTTDRLDTYKTFRLGVTQTFQPKLNGTVELRHTEQNSEVFGGDIRENALTATVLMQF
jgi:uncharacterized protein (PEP-CTERM system associated)